MPTTGEKGRNVFYFFPTYRQIQQENFFSAISDTSSSLSKTEV